MSPLVRKFFEGIILDQSRVEAEIPHNILDFIKNWAEYSKQVYLKNETFDIDGEVVNF